MKLPFLKDQKRYNQMRPWHGIVTYNYRTREYQTTWLGLNLVYAVLLAIKHWAEAPRWFLDRDELLKRAKWAEDDAREDRRKMYIYRARLELHGITTVVDDEEPIELD